MKNTMKVFGLIALVAVIGFSFIACDNGTDPDASIDTSVFTASVDGNSVTITRYTGSGGDVRIPSRINGKPVTTIGNSAFEPSREIDYETMSSIYLNQLTSVTIPTSVTSILDQAFAYNQLTSLVIPNSVTSIGNRAFYENQLTSVTIPNSVTSIGHRAFAENRLTNVTIPTSVTSLSGTFADNQLTSVTIPTNVTIIGSSTFQGNQLTNVVIPDGVTEIEQYAFYQNQLTSVTIGTGVTTIGGVAFRDNQLTSITIGANVDIEDTAFNMGDYDSIGFTEAYNSNDKAAGTYTRPNTDSTTWEKQ
jgi:hypothetical protein